MTGIINADNGKELKTVKKDVTEKKHIGNMKLSESKKAIKLHLFISGNNKYYVLPLGELQTVIENQKSGRFFEYIENIPEIVGELLPLKNKSDKYYQANIKTDIVYIKTTYINLLLKGSDLTLMIHEV